ncbi:inhibitor of growth protein 3 isoform X1 [Coccinella septempunctata]|uniref:inhibitor of growth protein 3 isoform X1 n=1 Tax=Coccinella septempunctata TaxID=41139 RepID=UPI001D08913D|nr:inhibitor of growth protein 3 isoform X1 [Coccinella septempunctata]
MLYLEDYLEMIEHLPQELRDRFTEMREMDLSVQNNMDDMEKRVRVFFNECKRYQNSELPPNLEQEFKSIRKEYYKTLEDADEKVHLANQMYELVDKYLRRLDTELHKFKCELEADNKGITEVLEKRSLELDVPVSASNISAQQQKENRYESFRYRPRSERRRESNNSLPSYVEKRQTIAPTAIIETRHSNISQATQVASNNVAYNLGHIGAGPAIAAAASQAIAATQQMQQGRRTASLKASYEAINTGGHGHEFSIGRELAGAAQTAIQAIQQDHANNRKKQKKWSSNNLSSSSSSTSAVQAIIQQPVVAPVVEPPPVDNSLQNAEVTDGEWTYDPNEPRYCLCNQVSYGDMVACDNEDCPSEWFHYPCVGITAPPKGKWYCPGCTASMKRRGGRKN